MMRAQRSQLVVYGRLHEQGGPETAVRTCWHEYCMCIIRRAEGVAIVLPIASSDCQSVACTDCKCDARSLHYALHCATRVQ